MCNLDSWFGTALQTSIEKTVFPCTLNTGALHIVLYLHSSLIDTVFQLTLFLFPKDSWALLIVDVALLNPSHKVHSNVLCCCDDVQSRGWECLFWVVVSVSGECMRMGQIHMGSTSSPAADLPCGFLCGCGAPCPCCAGLRMTWEVHAKSKCKMRNMSQQLWFLATVG